MNPIEAKAAQLVSAGAVLHTWNSPMRSHLVGDLAWLENNRLFWYVAHGDRPDDGHVLQYDSAQLAGEGVEFFRGGKRVGRICAIAHADVEDRDDFTVAFSLWRQVQPRMRHVIEESLQRAETGAA